MPKTFDVRITTLDAELEFSIEVNIDLLCLLHFI